MAMPRKSDFQKVPGSRLPKGKHKSRGVVWDETSIKIAIGLSMVTVGILAVGFYLINRELHPVPEIIQNTATAYQHCLDFLNLVVRDEALRREVCRIWVGKESLFR